MSDRTCSIEGCELKVKARGWCDRHYNRLRLLTRLDGSRGCNISGCEGPVCARGWCRAHYKRWRRYGDPLTADRPNVTRNRHIVNDKTGELIIAHRNGSESSIWFDAADLELVVAHHWYLSGGYVMSTLLASELHPGKVVSLHRLILGLGFNDERIGDHIDGNPSNNRRSNLRATDKAGNCANRAVMTSGSSMYRGVYWRKEQPHWRARFAQIHIGYFLTEENAATAVSAFRLENNFPTGY